MIPVSEPFLSFHFQATLSAGDHLAHIKARMKSVDGHASIDRGPDTGHRATVIGVSERGWD